MAYGNRVLVEKHGGLARVILNRPDKRNAMDDAMMEELLEALTHLKGQPDVFLLRLEGAGPVFTGGRDIANLKKMQTLSAQEIRQENQKFMELNLALAFFPRPTLAVVRGPALGAGSALVSWCDFAIAADNARFGYPEVGIGVPPAMTCIGVQRRLSRKATFEFILTGRPFDAAEAERIGFINRAVPEARLEEEVSTFTELILSKSPAAVSLAKQLLLATEDMDYVNGLRHSAEIMTIGTKTEDAQEGISAFLEKRKAVFKGR